MNNLLKTHSHLLWPLAVLAVLTVGVFFTSRQLPQEQDIRSRAQVDPSITQIPEATPSLSPSATTFSISFSLQGISSQGGNLKPLHPTRDVTLLFYDRDMNTSGSQAKPRYTVETTASFDDNPASPTYARFVQKDVKLAGVKEGQYQIGLKTDQALVKVFKAREINIAGILVQVGSNPSAIIPFGMLLTGDVSPSPQGDNTITIADYNEFMNCFGQSGTAACTANADLDDNGVVDGIDYNIFLRSFQFLLSLGTLVPTSALSPSPTVEVTPAVTDTPAPHETASNNSFWALFVFPFLFVAAIFMLFRNKFAKYIPFHRDEKVYFINQDKSDEKGWFTMADDNGQIRGHYAGGKIRAGFARVKGKMKSDGKNKYLEVSKIVWDDNP